jgi:hypothetical protein
MGQSYRIRTELGINKSINIQLDQQFEFLEILSLTLQQEDIYTKSCAQYGVVVGRVTANNGFGIPNARVSVFIPIAPVDESNPIISSIYPYKSPNDKNEDGYRYNLLPYEQSYSSHAATGTLPSRLDVLTGLTTFEIYDKYYKYSVKTNDSGDYMIMGVPQGNHTLVMDVDLSDIGEFSLTPQDLIRMGLASDTQVAGNRFRTSTDLNSLPQIINLTKDVEVSPLWGDPELCNIAINRVDFDLRDDANVDIQPTSVFMGSIYSTSDSYRVRPNARPADDMGNLCSLVAGPGQILAIRQTIYQDSDGNPVLEQHQLEQSGNIIDGNGVWLTELPMNLDYFVTNEFGEKIISNDPTVGIPTKAKYRFKIKWQQSANLSEQVRRPYYLVPNIKEYWSSQNDPNLNPNPLLKSTYYFGLAWSGYTQGFNTSPQKLNRLNEIINCDDTFYEFNFNKVYTVAGLIDEFKNGGRGQFIGIKEIDSQDCESTINKFPVNDGFRNFDLLFFIFAIILQIIQIIGIPFLIIYSIVAFLWNNFAVFLLAGLIIYIATLIPGQTAVVASTASAAFSTFPPVAGLLFVSLFEAIILGAYIALDLYLIFNFGDIVDRKFSPIRLPMITYPECQSCECDPVTNGPSGEGSTPRAGILTQLSNSTLYTGGIEQSIFNKNPTEIESNVSISASTISSAIAGLYGNFNNPRLIKSTMSFVTGLFKADGSPSKEKIYTYGVTLPPGERINIYNTRKKYFDTPVGAATPGTNIISVRFNYPLNGDDFTNNPSGKKHYDNTLTVLSNQDIPVGSLITFINKENTEDKNYLWKGTTSTGNYPLNGVNGIIENNQFNAPVTYATSQTSSSVVSYIIPSGNSTCFLSITFNLSLSGSVSYSSCVGGKRTQLFPVGTNTISDPNGIDIDSLSFITAEVNPTIPIIKGEACLRYIYPSDIEYYQVLTAITINEKINPDGTTTYSIPNLGPNSIGNNGYGFWHELINDNKGYVLIEEPDLGGWRFKTNNNKIFPTTPDFSYPTSIISDFKEQKILILQRGVDPYSPKLPNTYGIGKILGHPKEEDVVISAMTRMNIPIQAIPSTSTITVQNHKNVNEIFSGSYFYSPGIPNSTLFPNASTTPGLAFSSYTTSNVGYYGALDSTYLNPNGTANTSKFIVDRQGNKYYGNGTVSGKRTVNGLTFTYWMGNYGISNSVLSKGVSVVTNLSNNLFGTPQPNITVPPSPITPPRVPSTVYDSTEDLSGAAYMYRGNFTPQQESTYKYLLDDKGASILNLYFSPLLLPQFTGTTGANSKLTITPSTSPGSPQRVMRTDRLPSSDIFDVNIKKNDISFLNNTVPLLQQNLSFGAYSIDGGGISAEGASFSTGAQQVTADIDGQLASKNVIETLSDCEKLVGLNGYSGNGITFGVDANYRNQGEVENGCYVFVDEPLIGIPGDLELFAEWGYRFRFNYALCRGVLAQSFTNNWVNGSLYMFPIQADVVFDELGVPDSVFARQLVFFDETTNTFYYRSSPYLLSTGKFIGSPVTGLDRAVNDRNLLFPTTIVNLGMKDDVYQEILFDASAKGYIMKSLSPTTYSDTSDLVNLFVISRITNAGFLGGLLAGLNGAVNLLFGRKELRIDGDLAQSMSINSEYGVIPFSPQFYNVTGNVTDPVVILGTKGNPTMGIFFSSTTFDLQNKDFLSPGIINYRTNINSNTFATYEYGIKSQNVPFYQWAIVTGSTSPSIFGSETNNWATNQSNIFSQKYQSLSRRNADSTSNPSYFMSSNASGRDIYQRGYLFSINSDGSYSTTAGNLNGGNAFLVGAPNHFYFGVIKGESALDKFKTKYSVDE